MALTDFSWVNRYVVPSGAGSKTGTSWGDAFGLTEMVADITRGRKYNLVGDFTPSAIVDVSGSYSGNDPIAFVGWKADQSAEATSFSDVPSISGAGHSNLIILTSSNQLFRGLELKNGEYAGIQSLSKTAVTIDLVWVHDCNGTGGEAGMILTGSALLLTRCRVNSNPYTGIRLQDKFNVINCQVYDNGSAASYSAIYGVTYGRIKHCYVAGGGDGIRAAGTGISIEFNTVDACTTGIDSTAQAQTLIGNIITNCTTGLGNSYAARAKYNNLYGNTADASNATFNESNTYLDPQYVDIANHDYEIQNSSLLAQSLSPFGVAMTANIGAWQDGGAGGGGGGGAGSWRPESRRHGV